jgi:HSP20 family protein
MRELLGLDPYRELERRFPTAMGGVGFTPAFEVKEKTDAFVFRGDLPGLSEGDIEISFTGNRLTISGRREMEDLHEGETFYACERTYGSFSRSFTLPEGADVENATAELKDGVLLLTVPKRSEVKPRKITVTPGKQGQGQVKA